MAKPEHHWDFLDMGVIARLSRLTVSVRLPMLGSVTGIHRSATRGSSVEFAEYRKYAPGDDLKHLDWRVFGRTDKFFIREFEADTNLRCYVVLDTSASMNFTSTPEGGTRFDYARRLAGTLAHLLVHQGDAVGLTCFAEKVARGYAHAEAVTALQEALDEYTTLFGQINDEYLKERIADLRDVITRIAAHLSLEETRQQLDVSEPVILIAAEILPSQALAFDRLHVAGIITETGGTSGHAAEP